MIGKLICELAGGRFNVSTSQFRGDHPILGGMIPKNLIDFVHLVFSVDNLFI